MLKFKSKKELKKMSKKEYTQFLAGLPKLHEQLDIIAERPFPEIAQPDFKIKPFGLNEISSKSYLNFFNNWRICLEDVLRVFALIDVGSAGAARNASSSLPNSDLRYTSNSGFFTSSDIF